MTDESDLDFGDFEDDSNPVLKKIRDAYKAIKKENGDLRKENGELRGERRARTVTETLESKGVNTKFAKFYTSEDSSPEAVTAWLDENADLFGIEVQSPEDAETEQAAARISQATAHAPAQNLGTPADLQSRLQSAKTKAEFDAVMAELSKVRVPQ